MCLFIYSLSQQCGHQTFQNVSECPVARGIPLPHTAAHRHDATLPTPKFLFDTRRSKTHTPESYGHLFACPKRKAVRPVPHALCDECVASQQQQQRNQEEAETQRLLLLATVAEEVGQGLEKEEERSGCLTAPRMRGIWGRDRSASSGSSAALVGGGAAAPSASSTTSSLNTGMFCTVRDGVDWDANFEW